MVYIIGAHVLHKGCLNKILSKPWGEFEKLLEGMPLDTHEELRILYEEMSPRIIHVKLWNPAGILVKEALELAGLTKPHDVMKIDELV